MLYKKGSSKPYRVFQLSERGAWELVHPLLHLGEVVTSATVVRGEEPNNSSTPRETDWDCAHETGKRNGMAPIRQA